MFKMIFEAPVKKIEKTEKKSLTKFERHVIIAKRRVKRQKVVKT